MKRRNTDDDPAKPCIGVELGNLSCDAISAKASYDQARDADRQIYIGWVQALGLGLSLLFSAFATRAALKAAGQAEKGAQASRDSVVEAQRSADAAERSLAETQKVSRAELRPWITIDSHVRHMSFDENLVTIEYKVSFQNTGSTIACSIETKATH